MPTNRELFNYNPPFSKRTFVKLDSLQKVNLSDLEDVSISKNGKTLNQKELSYIINNIIRE